MTSAGDQAQERSATQVLAAGEMAELMRAFDWSSTPLGPVECWSPSLRTMVTVLLANRFPLLLMWGPDLCQLYNDAFQPVLGAKHPQALGQTAHECWSEIWHVIGPLLLTPYTGGPSTWEDDLLVEIHRHGFVEETHFTFAYSAVPDDTAPSGIGGVLATVHEITQQVIQERRLAVLRDLGARSTEAKTAEEACSIAAEVLEQHPKDVPFALLYLVDEDQQTARLAAAAGTPAGPPLGPLLVDLATDRDDGSPWPLCEVMRTEQAQVVTNLSERLAAVPQGPWSDPPDTALVLPLPSSTPHRPAGLLVFGLSARLALDEHYHSFGGLVAGQIGTAIVNARAYEEERKRAEALAELDRAKTAFFSNVSHEFRTPLTLLLGPLEEALSVPPDAPAKVARSALEIAHRNSLRLLRLVNTLLDFSRLEAGRVEASYEPVDLAALTADLASVFRSAIERAGLSLLVDCPPLSESVYVDRDMWEKIVLNLLSNAFKFTFEGEITVMLRQVEDTVELTVQDTGTGIPEEELPHIFERFHRIRPARARTHEGTGIGLALVRELVTLHGGTIGVASAMDSGTSVTVVLSLGASHLPAERIGEARTLASMAVGAGPYVEEALRWLPEAPGHPIAREMPGMGATPELAAETTPALAARVLLADDNADMRHYLLRLLSSRYTVEAVADGAEALAAIQTRPPDLVLADVMMPGMDGFAFLQALRSNPHTDTLPVILLSARAGEEAIAAGLEAGADDYLVKPFTASELLARVQAHLAMARLQQKARDQVAAERDRLKEEVAARVRAEEDLQRSHDHLRMALTSARMVTWEWDPHTDVVTTSENLADIYGVERLDTAAQGFALVHPDDRARHEAIVRHAAEMGESYESTFRIVRPDTGAVVWLEERGSAVADATGTLRKLIGVAVDATTRARVEAQLRQHAELLALAHDAIIVRDPHGGVLFWNEGAAELYGWKAAETVGKVTHDLLQTRVLSSGASSAETDAALAARGAWDGDLEHTRRDGTRVIVESRQALLRAADGTPEAILEVDRDATVREHLARVQRITAALSAALTIDQVADIIIHEGVAALGADAGLVAMLSDDGSSFTNVRTVGYQPEVVAAWPCFPADAPVPIADAIREGELLILESLEERGARYPHLAGVQATSGHGALVAIPLLIGKRSVGGLGLNFVAARGFTREERTVMRALGELCAQALDRARLYEAEQQSRVEAEAGRQRLGEIFQQVPAMICVLRGPEHVYEVANALYQQGVGRSSEELLGRPVREVFPEIVDQGILDLLDRVYRAGISHVEIETLVRLQRNKDGPLDDVYLTFTYEPLRDAAGAVEGILVFAVDVTAQVQARQRIEDLARQLQAGHDRLQQVVDLLPAAVMVTDTELIIQVSNQAVRTLFGASSATSPLPIAAGEAVPADDATLYSAYGARHLDGTPYHAAELPMARAALRGEEVHGEQMLVRRATDGRDVPILINAAPLRDASGTILGGVVVFQDITAIRELERARDEFLSSAAHDLRTPLTGIRGHAQLAQRRLAHLETPDSLTASVLRQLARIIAGTDAMVDLINELMDLARLEAGTRLDLHPQPADLVALVREAIAIQQSATSIRIELEAATPELVANVDTARIARVVGNLLSNAIKYSPDGGHITVRVAREDVSDPEAIIAVVDRGLGIPSADLPYIFDRFTRATNVVGHIQGTGIGLAGARGIVEQHGGTIGVTSQEGIGSTLTVRLPLSPPDETSDTSMRALAGKGRTRGTTG